MNTQYIVNLGGQFRGPLGFGEMLALENSDQIKGETFVRLATHSAWGKWENFKAEHLAHRQASASTNPEMGEVGAAS
jgi:hypothetical protein